MRVDLDERLDAWLRDGLISPAQADTIRARERELAGADDRTTLAAEAVGYLGAALALIAGGLVVSRYWDRIESWGQLLLELTVAGVTFLAGWWVRQRPGAAVARLVSLLWAGSVAATAAAVALVGRDLLDLGGPATAVLTGVAVVVVGGALYTLRPRALQQLAILAGVLTAATGAILLPGSEPDAFYPGLLVAGLGIAWFLLGAGGWLTPRTTALVAGGLVAGIGLNIAPSGSHATLGLVLALVVTVAVGVASVTARSTLMLGFAVAGTFVFVPRSVFHFFGDSLGAPFALLLTGLVLIGVAVGSLRLRRDLAEEG